MLLEALLALAAEREDVRRSLATVNAWLARELNQRAESARNAVRREDGGREAARVDEPRPDDASAEASHGVLVPRSASAAPAPAAEDARPVDLERVRSRAAWKGEALRLALAKRAAGAAPGPELRQREADLRARQSAVGGPWAWMLDAPPARVEDAALASLALCYEMVARASQGLSQLEQADALEPAPPVELLRLVAETQSALLAALGVVGLRQDEDQRDLFQWLRDRTTRHRIYVDRHMRLEDPADPNAVADLWRRFDELHEKALKVGAGRRQRVHLLNKVRYHVRKLIDGGAQSAEEWHSLGAALVRWAENGLELSDKGLVDVLGALAGLDVPALPLEAGGEGAATPDPAVAALKEALAHALGSDPTRADAVSEVRRLLEHKRALMVAEKDDPGARFALGDAFALAHLDWLSLPPPIQPAAAPEAAPAEAEPTPAAAAGPEVGASAARVARIVEALAAAAPDVVFMGLRLPQEEYQAFKDRCVELQLPFVRLPGAPTPGAVAHQTMRQVGWRLKDQRPASR